MQHLTARAAELNLSIAEAKALQNLDPNLAMPMRGLAARVHANPSNVTVIVDRLAARGLVSREVSGDRRVNRPYRHIRRIFQNGLHVSGTLAGGDFGHALVISPSDVSELEWELIVLQSR